MKGGAGREKDEEGCEERVDVVEEVYQQVLGTCEHNFNDGGRSVLEENEPLLRITVALSKAAQIRISGDKKKSTCAWVFFVIEFLCTIPKHVSFARILQSS